MAFAGQKLRASQLDSVSAGDHVLADDGITDAVAGQPVNASQVD